MKYMDLVKSKLGPNLHFSVVFGATTNATTVTGAIKTSAVTIDRITALPDDLYERQVVTADHSIDGVGHRRFGTTEMVSDFHLSSASEMEVTLAMVKYSTDGAMDSKVIMHGKLVKR